MKAQKTSILKDDETGIEVKIKYDKYFTNNKYEIYFDSRKGIEILKGCNGNKDPFFTELPLMFDIGIMGHCKNRCSICYQGREFEEHMKLEDFKIIIDQIKHHATQIALGGRGDPNLHPNFKEIIEYSRKNEVVPNYTTSGIGITKDQIKISKMCGAVAVSDYGKSYTYRALNKLIDSGIKTNVHLVFTRTATEKIMKILYGYNPWKNQCGSFFDIEKLNAVVILLFKPQGEGSGYIDFIPRQTDIEKVSELIMTPKSSFKIGMDSCLVNHIFQIVKFSKIKKLTLDTCEAARMSAYISPSMKMIPCSFANKKIGVQIDKKNAIENIWKKSKAFKKFRKTLKSNRFCCPAGF